MEQNLFSKNVMAKLFLLAVKYSRETHPGISVYLQGPMSHAQCHMQTEKPMKL